MQSTLSKPTLNSLVKWLSKKESTLSLHFKKKKTSPAQSILFNESNIERDNKYDDDQPPAYEDKTHPWVFEFPDYLKSRTVLPREEEGNEIIPDYQCTVQKTELSIGMKCEKTKSNIKAKDRSWRNICLELRGTIIMAYIKKQKHNRVLWWSHSMEGAKASLAKDYTKYRHVIRVSFKDGRQFLLRTQSDKHSADWIALIESSANICTDLDQRLMPEFSTLPTRQGAGHRCRRRI